MSSPRNVAIAIIQTVDEGAIVQDALNRHICQFAPADRKFCSDLVYGTLRNRIKIRQILARLLKRPRRLPPAMRIAMETALYSILFQDKVPDFAAVNEATKFVKKRFGQNLANVTNGVLRALLRDQSTLIAQDKSCASTCAVETYSLPLGIAGLWGEAYGGKNALKLAQRSAQRPHPALRVNVSHPQASILRAALLGLSGAEEAGLAGVAFAAGSLPGEVLGHELKDWHDRGAVSFQAAASQLILQKLGVYELWQRLPIWDACAGFGGKSLALLESGLNVKLCSDPSRHRLKGLSQQCCRLNLPVPAVMQADACSPPLKEWSGNILADVPCSGLGVLARRPDLKDRWNPENTRRLINLQRQILTSLCLYLKPERELCYLTCTLNPAENEDQIEWLLNRHSGLRIVNIWQTPHEHPWLEGMFGVRIAKTE